MSVLTLYVDEVMRTLSNDGQYPFVENDKTVDIVRFAINTGFTDVVFDEHSALRVMYQRPGESEVRARTLTYYDTDGLHNYYDWQLSQSDLAKNGSLMVALCILRTDNTVEEWHTTPYQIRVLGTIHTDDSDEADETITPTVAQRVAVLESMIQRVASGAPIVVASTSAMTDTSQIYVLSTDGNWYYHNGSAWVAGGEYGAVATDTTLTQPGIPADAKAVGDALAAGGSGLTEQEKSLILALFRKTAYASDASTEYATLADLWDDSPEPTPVTGLIHRWDLTQSLIDTVGGVTASVGGATQGQTGVVFTSAGQYLDFGAVYAVDHTYELDVAELTSAFGTQAAYRSRIFSADYDTNTVQGASAIVHSVSSDAHGGWYVYPGTAWNNDFALSNVGELTDYTYFSGRTVKVYVSSDNKWTIKSRPIGSSSSWTTHLVTASVSPLGWGEAGRSWHVLVGGSGNDNPKGMTVSGLRVYEGEV